MSITKEIGRNPKVDWIIVLVSSFILAVIIALSSSHLYKIVTKDNINKVDESTIKTDKIYDSKALSKVLDNYSERAETWNKAKIEYTGFTDPSI